MSAVLSISTCRSFRPADRVFHGHHGYGAVIASRGDREIMVRFDRAPRLPRTVPVSLVEPVDEEAAPAPAPRLLPTRQSGRKNDPALRQAIEALRMGVVPAEHGGSYTVGREDAISRLRAFFRERSGLRMIWGDYGFGKTHLLDLAEHEAIGAGMVT